MVGASSTTQMILVHLDEAHLCQGADWVAGGVAQNIASIRVASLQAVGSASHLTADITARNGVGCTAPCVSTETNVGGIDTGVIAANTHYCLWLVANTTSWGLVWSATCSNSGPAVGVLTTYPYYAYLGWNYSNAGATGFAYQLQKIDTVTYYVGTVLPVLYTAACGSVAAWCTLSVSTVVSPNAGAVNFMLNNDGTSGYVAIAPVSGWGTSPVCFILPGAAGENIFQTCGPLITSGSTFGYAITSTSGNQSIRIVSFTDSR